MIKDISALHQLSVLYFPFSEATPEGVECVREEPEDDLL